MKSTTDRLRKTSVAGTTTLRTARESSSTLRDGTFVVRRPDVHGETTSNDAVAKAVYAHIRAIRTLGRTNVTTGEIARALNIPTRKVDSSIAELKRKGVKLAG